MLLCSLVMVVLRQIVAEVEAVLGRIVAVMERIVAVMVRIVVEVEDRATVDAAMEDLCAITVENLGTLHVNAPRRSQQTRRAIE